MIGRERIESGHPGVCLWVYEDVMFTFNNQNGVCAANTHRTTRNDAKCSGPYREGKVAGLLQLPDRFLPFRSMTPRRT